MGIANTCCGTSQNNENQVDMKSSLNKPALQRLRLQQPSRVHCLIQIQKNPNYSYNGYINQSKNKSFLIEEEETQSSRR